MGNVLMAVAAVLLLRRRARRDAESGDPCTPHDSGDCDPANTPACAPSFPHAPESST
ncbi:hypothetical protein GCM10027168_66410 [Streptomyces capparidis]